jgi:hypothetical protein
MGTEAEKDWEIDKLVERIKQRNRAGEAESRFIREEVIERCLQPMHQFLDSKLMLAEIVTNWLVDTFGAVEIGKFLNAKDSEHRIDIGDLREAIWAWENQLGANVRGADVDALLREIGKRHKGAGKPFAADYSEWRATQ